jgi:hypothetical protein
MTKRPWVLGILCLLLAGRFVPGQTSKGESWFFAVSGDSRDCGDLIMPKIARAIAEARPPVAFYWHLGDLRRIYDVDCDMEMRRRPDFNCEDRSKTPLGAFEMSEYLDSAWDDFLERQITPFGKTQVFIGIGNHELYAQRTRADFQRKFQKWLTQEPIHQQRGLDSSRNTLLQEGSTTFHFVMKGVDFIYLDNADTDAFTAKQLLWLSKVLAADTADPSVKTIVVGMHEALPFSTARDHAMDESCQGRCSGQDAYDRLVAARERKNVYVFASHQHYFRENIFDTPEHRGQVLPGWIVGTAGAIQYESPIRYGYLEVEVRSDGTLAPRFREVKRDSPPAATGPGAQGLTNFCFERNLRATPPREPAPLECACGAVK